jgi:hypothetical protein
MFDIPCELKIEVQLPLNLLITLLKLQLNNNCYCHGRRPRRPVTTARRRRKNCGQKCNLILGNCIINFSAPMLRGSVIIDYVPLLLVLWVMICIIQGIFVTVYLYSILSYNSKSIPMTNVYMYPVTNVHRVTAVRLWPRVLASEERSDGDR